MYLVITKRSYVNNGYIRGVDEEVSIKECHTVDEVRKAIPKPDLNALAEETEIYDATKLNGHPDGFRITLTSAISLDNPNSSWATQILAQHLIANKEQTLSELRAMITETNDDRIVALLGNFGPEDFGEDIYSILDMALHNDDFGVRDAAVCVIDAWRTPQAINMLRTHTERNPWLRRFIQEVIDTKTDLHGQDLT